MTSIHEAPKTEEDREAVLQILADQAQQAWKAEQVLVTCGSCSRSVPLWVTYRCFFCGIRFCKRCARIHFGPERKL